LKVIVMDDSTIQSNSFDSSTALGNPDEALRNITDALSTSWLNGVNRGDVQRVVRELSQLSPEDASKVFGQLSDKQLESIGKEINDNGWLGNDGLDASEKTAFFNTAAQQLDGQQLARFSSALEGADVTAMGNAIANGASAQTKADFIQQMASTGQIQTGSSEAGAKTQNYTNESRAVAASLSSLSGDPAQFDRAVAALSDQQLKTVVDAASGEAVEKFAFKRDITTHDASELKKLQATAEQTGSVQTQNRVLRAVNEEIAGLKRPEQAALGLTPSIVPGIPASAEQVQAKKAELAEQRQMVSDLRAQGTPEANALANKLEQDYRARELGNLASDVYHWASPSDHTQLPVGWTRASEDPQTLAKYGLTVDQLRPANSEFRAELYIPDPAIFGADAKPVLAFKGTTPSSTEDWANNFTQGTGKQTPYYDRAMTMASRVNQMSDGNFELTGHSLGGGLASAASAVTGAQTTTFNSAGLHPSTAQRFLSENPGLGVRAAFDTNKTVTPYQVKGEILTTLQESAKGIDPQRAEQLGSVVRFAAGVASNPFVQEKTEGFTNRNLGDFGGLALAQGSDLLSMAEAAGTPNAVKLDAYENGPAGLQAAASDAASFVGPNGLATRADVILDRYDASVAAADARAAATTSSIPGVAEAKRTYIRTEGRVAAGREAYADYKADPVLQAAPGALAESVKRHGTYNESLDRRIDTLEAQANTLLNR
jgi:Protein of unknown function (DUF2974)